MSAPRGRAEPGTGRERGEGTGSGTGTDGPGRTDGCRHPGQGHIQQPGPALGQGVADRLSGGDAGQRVGHGVGQEAGAAVVLDDEATGDRGVVAEADPVGRQGPSAREPVIETQTTRTGVGGEVRLGVDPPLPQGPGPRALDHDIGGLEQARSRAKP